MAKDDGGGRCLLRWPRSDALTFIEKRSHTILFFVSEKVSRWLGSIDYTFM